MARIDDCLAGRSGALFSPIRLSFILLLELSEFGILPMHFRSFAKALIRAPFRFVGLDIRRLQAVGSLKDTENPLNIALGLAGRSIRVAFDIGAHEGETIERLRSVLVNGRIYAFEADPRSVLYLKKRYADERNLVLVDRAVSDRSGPIAFHLNEYSATSSVYPRPGSGRRYYPSLAAHSEVTSVEALRLDDFAAENNIGEIDLLKIDIQGGELDAFRGAERLLRERRIKVIYTEAYFVPHYENAPLLWDQAIYLAQFGYTIFGLYDEYVASNGQLRYADAIFVSSETRRTVIDAAPQEP